MTNDEREELLSMLSDLSKDAYGFRVRDHHLRTDQELLELVDYYQGMVDDYIEREMELEAKAVEALANDFGVDQDAILRWMKDANDE